MSESINSSDVQQLRQLGSDAEFAVRALAGQLSGAFEEPRELFSGYIFTKRILADFMQALIRSQISNADIGRFQELQKRIKSLLMHEYKDIIPAKYLNVPYGSPIHAELFAVLYRRRGEPVEAELLRIVTGDSVHTERRTRELRELGLDILASRAGSANTYILQSLDIDHSRFGAIVAKQIRADRSLPVTRKDVLLSRL